ncbi:hypothetical protein WJX72_012497 [[Myrmecia] bisecta]|uniref:Hexosyltransferase n=1 Tax=[Myrmecia] bisecta TaxID=41462 RepID=A0AAW1Q6N3_9CHLO
MGSDGIARKSRTASFVHRTGAWRIAVWVGILPFLFGLFALSAFFRHSELPSAEELPQNGYRTTQSKCNGTITAGSEQRLQQPCPCANGLDKNDPVHKLAGLLTEGSVNAVLEATNTTDPAAQTVRVNEDALESVFLFIGVLSGRGYRHRRLAVREAWANDAQVPGLSAVRFILSEDERTPQVQKEVETFKDIVFAKEKTTYKSILYKTYFVLEHAVTHFDVRFILKTDDDAFINVKPLIGQLRLLCESPACKQERIYMGRMAKDSEVLLQPGHKWNNIIFHNHTGLKQYPNYMMGGGYVVSGDVAMTLVNVNRKMKLKFTPIEDATLGFWLMSMDLRHIDHKRFFTWAAPCCFKAPVRREGQRIVTRFQLVDEMESDLCSNDPWLVLHKIDSPTKMRYIGQRVMECEPQEPGHIAPSIAAYVRREEPASEQQQRPEVVPERRRRW